MSDELDLLFVYGTLMEDGGGDMASLLGKHSEKIGPGEIRGRLYDLGDYPGAVDSEKPEETVQGTLYRLKAPDEILPVLDEYEEYDPQDEAGSLFRREKRSVTLPNGERLKAWVYLYDRPVKDFERIRSGEYRSSGLKTSRR